MTVPDEPDRPGRAAARAAGARAPGHAQRGAGTRRRALPPAAEGTPAGHRLPQAPRPERRDRQALRPGLCAARLAQPGQRLPALRRPAAGRKRHGHRAGRRRTGAEALRPLSRTHHVPDPLGQGRGHRLRRPRARQRRAQVPELARDAGLRQGPRAVRPVRGAHRAAQQGLRAGGRGLHGRGGAGADRASPTPWPRSARPARPSMCRSCSASPTRWSSASTATPPAGAPPAARWRPPCRMPPTCAACASCSCRPSTTRTASCANSGPTAFDAQVAKAVPLSRQLIEQAGQGADLGSAEGRARMLAQAKPLWQALPDGALRRQLLPELARQAQMERGRPGRAVGPGSGRRSGAAGAGARCACQHAARRHAAPRPAWPTRRCACCCATTTGGSACPARTRACCTSWAACTARCLAWLERQITEHGPQTWAALDEAMADEAWAALARGWLEGRGRRRGAWLRGPAARAAAHVGQRARRRRRRNCQQRTAMPTA